MPFEPVKPPYKTRQVLICTNVRDPSLNRPSCGANGGLGLRASEGPRRSCLWRAGRTAASGGALVDLAAART